MQSRRLQRPPTTHGQTRTPKQNTSEPPPNPPSPEFPPNPTYTTDNSNVEKPRTNTQTRTTETEPNQKLFWVEAGPKTANTTGNGNGGQNLPLQGPLPPIQTSAESFQQTQTKFKRWLPSLRTDLRIRNLGFLKPLPFSRDPQNTENDQRARLNPRRNRGRFPSKSFMDVAAVRSREPEQTSEEPDQDSPAAKMNTGESNDDGSRGIEQIQANANRTEWRQR